jgi:hypothetical protein
LHGFIDGYAQFAKVPAPRLETVAWPAFLAGSAAHSTFRFEGEPPQHRATFDPVQMEQALINLLKNAHEHDRALQGRDGKSAVMPCQLLPRPGPIPGSGSRPGLLAAPSTAAAIQSLLAELIFVIAQEFAKELNQDRSANSAAALRPSHQNSFQMRH